MAAITPATASLRLTKKSVKFGLVTQESTARVCARKRQNSRPGGLTPGLLRISSCLSALLSPHKLNGSTQLYQALTLRPRYGSGVLWWPYLSVCLFACLFVCPQAYLWNYKSDLRQFLRVLHVAA